MKIKEVEQRTGISSANIRFYEKEGLLTPKRSKENNYRDYTEQDVERLEQIKILRLLGISIEDIKSIYRNELILEEVISGRVSQLDEEEKHVREVRKACENILMRHMDVSMLDEQVLGSEQAIWSERLKKVLAEDTTKVWIGKLELNRHIAGFLIWGYVINLIMVFIFRGIILTGENLFAKADRKADEIYLQTGRVIWVRPMELTLMGILMMIMVVLGIAIIWTASMKVHMVIFHIAAVAGSPILMLASALYTSSEIQQKLYTFLPFLWIGTIVYILGLWLLSEKWDGMFTRDRNAVGIAFVSTILLTSASYMLFHEWIIPLILFLIVTVYIGLFWSVTNTDVEEYNRYYAIKEANRIMNPAAVLTSYWGKAKSGFWR